MTKKTLTKTVLYLAQALIWLLIILSVFGAFLGAERAKTFFNGTPLAIFWSALIVVLLLGFVFFVSLRKKPTLLMMHLGCVFIIAGSMWSSQPGQRFWQQLSGNKKIISGKMAIFENKTENKVSTDSGEMSLPFDVKLNDFKIEYYQPEYILVNQASRSFQIPVELNKEFSLGADYGKMKVLRVFKNFRINIVDGKRDAYDFDGPGSNSAVKAQITLTDGSVFNTYIFRNRKGHVRSLDDLEFTYHKTIKDYISDIEIVKDGKVVAAKSIEVNKPLRYGGHHFYQYSYDERNEQYTVLSVVSDSGLNFIYIGFAMLCAGGYAWHFGVVRLTQFGKVKNGN